MASPRAQCQRAPRRAASTCVDEGAHTSSRLASALAEASAHVIVLTAALAVAFSPGVSAAEAPPPDPVAAEPADAEPSVDEQADADLAMSSEESDWEDDWDD